jgi:hypothetical protein
MTAKVRQPIRLADGTAREIKEILVKSIFRRRRTWHLKQS